MEYSFGRNNKSGEVHIFRCKLTKDAQGKAKCEVLEPNSICKGVAKGDVTWLDGHGCVDEQSARNLGAKLGRGLCGVCVSDLYLTPKK
jgi:hypothetical protein